MLLNNDGVGREGETSVSGQQRLGNKSNKREKEKGGMGEFIRIIVLHSCSPAFLRTRLLDYSLKTVKVIINEVKTHPIIS